MNECCGGSASDNGSDKAPTKSPCPANGKDGLSVPFATIWHHLKAPWNMKDEGQDWYFCDDPACETAYFALDGSQISKTELRPQMAVKGDADGLVCFCYGVNAEAATNPAIKSFVVEQTKLKNCACDKRNPSGRCCLKNFPK